MKQINLAEWAIKHKQIVYFFIFSSSWEGSCLTSLWGEARILPSPSAKPS